MKVPFHIHNGKADFSPLLDFYINELTIHVCIIANGFPFAFPMASFSGLSDLLECLGGLHYSSNGSSLTGQGPTQLEIAT